MERWKDVKGYEALYMVSSLGRMKAYEKIRKVGNSNGFRIYPELIMKQRVNRSGYLYVILCKNGIQKTFTVHRIVAKHFLTPKIGKDIVNHLDSNTTNNNYDNLEWTTVLGNSQHSVNNGRAIRKPDYFNKRYIKVFDQATGKKYRSILSAANCIGISHYMLRKMLTGRVINNTNFKLEV